MEDQHIYRRKPFLTEHEKLMRFFIRLCVGLCVPLALAIFLLLNRSSLFAQ